MNLRSFLAVLLLTLLTVGVIAADEANGGSLLWLRAPLSILFFAFAPGYALQAALLPRPGALSSLERIAFSIGLSVAALAPLVLVLDSVGWGLHLWPLTISLAILTILCAVIAFFLYKRWGTRKPNTAPQHQGLKEWWQAQTPTQRRLALGALGLVVVVSAYTILWLASPHPEEYFTEFYLLGAGGVAEAYPQDARVGQPLEVQIGVTNRERKPQVYMIIAQSSGQTVGYLQPFTLPSGQSLIQTLTLIMPETGEQKRVDIFLLRLDETTPYRELTLWLNVEP